MPPVKVTQGNPRDSYAHTCTHTHSHLDGGESEREWQMLIFCFTCVWVGRTYLVRHEWRVTWLWVTAKCLLTSYRQCGLSLSPPSSLDRNSQCFGKMPFFYFSQLKFSDTYFLYPLTRIIWVQVIHALCHFYIPSNYMPGHYVIYEWRGEQFDWPQTI